ncbi:MAG: hypothetical protein RL595_1646 [Planctomycetota bacterium]
MNASRLLAEIADAEKLVLERGRDVETSGRSMQAPWTVRLQAWIGS